MDIIYRTQWNAKPNKGSLVRMSTLKKIVLHHAAGYNDQAGNLSIERVQEIQALHQNQRRWNDIGYHFLLDSTGCVYQGRDFYNQLEDIHVIPDFVHGAHVKFNNSDKIGICLLGCFHPSAGGNCQDEITEESFDSLIELCIFICSRYNLVSDDIVLHRDLRNSACPGNNIASQLTLIRSEVHAELLLG